MVVNSEHSEIRKAEALAIVQGVALAVPLQFCCTYDDIRKGSDTNHIFGGPTKDITPNIPLRYREGKS